MYFKYIDIYKHRMYGALIGIHKYIILEASEVALQWKNRLKLHLKGEQTSRC